MVLDRFFIETDINKYKVIVVNNTVYDVNIRIYVKTDKRIKRWAKIHDEDLDIYNKTFSYIAKHRIDKYEDWLTYKKNKG